MSASFGSWLKQRRKALGWSQQELAEQVGCSAVLIRKIEGNERRPSRQIAELIIQKLSIETDDHETLLRLARLNPSLQTDSVEYLSAVTRPSTFQPLSPLTERERDILKLILADLADSTIAERLSLKLSTVRWYVKQIYSKFGVHSRDEVMLAAGHLQEVQAVHETRDMGIHHNLPSTTTSLVGRGQEIKQLYNLLLQPSVRLLTLVGTAGVGKTRLSLETAAVLVPEFGDGVYFVALASLTDSTLLANAIAQVLGVFEVGGESLLDALKHYLREKYLLLVLDNFEHLLAAASLVADLLATTTKLKILTTSRERLHIYGEHEYQVPPLPLPDNDVGYQMSELVDNECVSLFVQRAKAVKSDFHLTENNAGTVSEICTRLDGLPLAIELAAARVKLYSPTELRKRLHQKLATLTGGARDLPERHQTLRGALAWSYDLLSVHEQTLFARLGIFVGGWTLDAMAVVCGAGLPIDVYDGLESLLNKSLVQPMMEDTADPRFTMLETVREYALEKLIEHGEAEAVRRRYARFFLEMVEGAEPLLQTAERAFWLAQLRVEDGNIRSILREFSEHRLEEETALRIAAALWHFWATEGRYNEGIYWLDSLLTPSIDVSPALRAKALHAYATLDAYVLNWQQASKRYQEALEFARDVGNDWICAHTLAWLGRIHPPLDDKLIQQWLDESLILARRLNDPWLIATVLVSLGIFWRQHRDFERSRAALQESLALVHALGLAQEIGIFTVDLGETAAAQGDLIGAKSLMMEGITYLRETGNGVIIADCLSDLGDVERLLGAFDLAAAAYEEALHIWREHGNKVRETRALFKLGYTAIHKKHTNDAETLFRQSLAQAYRHQASGNMIRSIALALMGLATIAAERQAWLRAVTLLGAAHTQFQSIQRTFTHLTPADRAEVETLIAVLKRELDGPTYASHWEVGAQMNLDQAVAYALEG